jgi:formylglycine-generating enzyme required for sulfatase activity
MKSIPILFLLAVVQVAANLPHRVKVLKQKKDQAIYSSLSLVYKDYTESLLQLQTELVASNRLRDANSVQSEFFLNTGYLNLIGKSYQFVFDPPKTLPNEAKIYRETRNEKVKITLRRNIMAYIDDLKKAQSFYMRSQNLVDARKATDEMRLATFELSKIDTIVSVGSSIPSPLPQLPLSNKSRTFELGNGIKLEMIWVSPGSFIMGSPSNEIDRRKDEIQREVIIRKGFYLGKYEVTQAQYEVVMRGNNQGINSTPSKFTNKPNHPVEMVSNKDALVFLMQLTMDQASLIPSGWKFSLPSEEQWEYACRSNTKTAYSFGPKITKSNANYNWNGVKETKQTKEVGCFPPNQWGFHDLHGNVWELTSTNFNGFYANQKNSILPIRKGGSYSNKASFIRSAIRLPSPPHFDDIGFRVCLKEAK